MGHAAAAPAKKAEEPAKAPEPAKPVLRIVKAADKLQMMAKVLAYEAEGRGDLAREGVRIDVEAGIRTVNCHRKIADGVTSVAVGNPVNKVVVS